MKSGECSPSGILGEGWKIMYEQRSNKYTNQTLNHTNEQRSNKYTNQTLNQQRSNKYTNQTLNPH